jgi:hypothetical protein
MSEGFAEIVKRVEAYLQMHPNIALHLVAKKLGIAPSLIEESMHAVEGITYKEYQEQNRLSQAFKHLGLLSPAANGPYEIVRARHRLVIPRATVRYGIPGFWNRKIKYSNSCPLVDLSRDGLALLTDHALSANKRISTLLKFPGEEELVQVEGRIVYSVATGIAGYRYRIGVQFLPFSGQKGCNTLASLGFLINIEKAYTS